MSCKNETSKRFLLKQQLVEMLGGKCVDCGQMPHLVAMDFDHIDPSKKKFNMAPLIGRASSGEEKHIKELMEEVKKCVLRCANCHRIKSFVNREVSRQKDRKNNKHKKKWMFQ